MAANAGPVKLDILGSAASDYEELARAALLHINGMTLGGLCDMVRSMDTPAGVLLVVLLMTYKELRVASTGVRPSLEEMAAAAAKLRRAAEALIAAHNPDAREVLLRVRAACAAPG